MRFVLSSFMVELDDFLAMFESVAVLAADGVSSTDKVVVCCLNSLIM
jgi:hypothetical protein